LLAALERAGVEARHALHIGDQFPVDDVQVPRAGGLAYPVVSNRMAILADSPAPVAKCGLPEWKITGMAGRLHSCVLNPGHKLLASERQDRKTALLAIPDGLKSASALINQMGRLPNLLISGVALVGSPTHIGVPLP